jgi:hypothetical protein
VLGIVSVAVGGVAFATILLGTLIYQGWKQKIEGDPYKREWYRAYQGTGERYAELHLEVRDLATLVMLGGAFLLPVGGLLGGLSFIGRAKRHWSIAGCVVNGLLLVWVLFRCGML